MPKFSAKNFCDGLEMKFASPSAGMQQAGAPETAAKSVILLLSVGDYKRIYTSLYFIITTSTRSLSLMWRSAMAWILQHLHFTQYLINHGELINHIALVSFD